MDWRGSGAPTLNFIPDLRLREPRGFIINHDTELKELRVEFFDFMSATIQQLLDCETTRLEGNRDPTGSFEHFASSKDAVANDEERVYLLKPFGALDADLGLLLHYPTFSTSPFENGSVADWANRCMRILFRKGLRTQTCLRVDRFCLRRKLDKQERRAGKFIRERWARAQRVAHEK